MWNRQDFCVLILTHGRPDRVYTVDTLKRCGYTGPVYLVVDDLDSTVPQYQEEFPGQVIVFDKKAVAKTFDRGDNFENMKTIIFARNASFEIAKQLGFKYFLQLDDDYRHFQYRFDDALRYRPKVIKDLDSIFGHLLEFFISSGATTFAFAQGGDFIGGAGNPMAESVRLKRKAMNSFFCSTDRPFKFIGRINEDVNTYVRLGSVGELILTTNQLTLEQMQTQSNAGGMTETYLESGTYLKSFYSVMYQPSSVRVALLQDREQSRLHHRVMWKNTVPMILRESIRK